jgi:hypothetical protein
VILTPATGRGKADCRVGHDAYCIRLVKGEGLDGLMPAFEGKLVADRVGFLQLVADGSRLL